MTYHVGSGCEGQGDALGAVSGLEQAIQKLAQSPLDSQRSKIYSLLSGFFQDFSSTSYSFFPKNPGFIYDTYSQM
jgi:hypothetical protein